MVHGVGVCSRALVRLEHEVGTGRRSENCGGFAAGKHGGFTISKADDQESDLIQTTGARSERDPSA
jgi:hypothetical protein